MSVTALRLEQNTVTGVNYLPTSKDTQNKVKVLLEEGLKHQEVDLIAVTGDLIGRRTPNEPPNEPPISMIYVGDFRDTDSKMKFSSEVKNSVNRIISMNKELTGMDYRIRVFNREQWEGDSPMVNEMRTNNILLYIKDC